MSETLFMKEQAMCLAILVGFTLIGIFTDKIPIQVSITCHSMLIIAIGSYKSLEEMIKQIKSIHIDKDGKASGIEKMGFDDAWQFPIVAGCSLCGLYFMMQYFG